MGTIIINMVDMFYSFLKRNSRLQDIDFVEEFPPMYKENPLHKVTIVIGLESSDVLPSDEPNASENRYLIKLRIRMNIHAPITSSGWACMDAFSRLMQEAVTSLSEVTGFGCEGTKFDRSTATLYMKAWTDCKLYATLGG